MFGQKLNDYTRRLCRPHAELMSLFLGHDNADLIALTKKKIKKKSLKHFNKILHNGIPNFQ